MGRMAKPSIHDINWIVDTFPNYNNNPKTNSLLVVEKRILRDFSDGDDDNKT
jgi:hypothetical protein